MILPSTPSAWKESGLEVRMSDHELSRRDFIKVTAGIVGGTIGAAIGLPAVAYLLQPALRSGGKQAWIPIGKLADMEIGKPYAFTFTRIQVNGWERTANSYGGFALRRSESADDILILSNTCTHLACHVNWKEDLQHYVCPCHDGHFAFTGEVLSGPPPRPLDQYNEFQVDENGNLLIHFIEG
jgi:Rieske Fe-S protein